ncbi:uncharacterized protein RAG0_04591 [Rhynchosporium agropyri]|uniref:Uncharacterized protein n=1 Tax=Rhynchosporium agropyri TaxID=914238 RepID=A0A1E1K9I7_9HELO|nr:uncharacterized protein RAG0_04591 [Rhynchosporium agropyri]
MTAPKGGLVEIGRELLVVVGPGGWQEPRRTGQGIECNPDHRELKMGGRDERPASRDGRWLDSSQDVD